MRFLFVILLTLIFTICVSSTAIACADCRAGPDSSISVLMDQPDLTQAETLLALQPFYAKLLADCSVVATSTAKQEDAVNNTNVFTCYVAPGGEPLRRVGIRS